MFRKMEREFFLGKEEFFLVFLKVFFLLFYWCLFFVCVFERNVFSFHFVFAPYESLCFVFVQESSFCFFLKPLDRKSVV